MNILHVVLTDEFLEKREGREKIELKSGILGDVFDDSRHFNIIYILDRQNLVEGIISSEIPFGCILREQQSMDLKMRNRDLRQ